MKTALLALALMASQTSFAAITNSTFAERHQTLLETAIEKNCGHMRNLTVESVVEETIRIDQGITDVKYTTVLTGEQRMDQNIFDTYKIIVTSEYADMYDHAAKDWGVYSVTSVKCFME